MKKSILITGATSGIGLATVKLFSINEYTAFASYRKEQDKNTLLQIQNVNPIKMDVTSSVEKAVLYLATCYLKFKYATS